MNQRSRCRYRRVKLLAPASVMETKRGHRWWNSRCGTSCGTISILHSHKQIIRAMSNKYRVLYFIYRVRLGL